MTTTYEWVAERLDANGDITDTAYWGQGNGAKAFTAFREFVAAAEADNGGASFGLCRKVGNEADGEIERAYAYVEADYLGGFDNGCNVPQALRAQFNSFWKA